MGRFITEPKMVPAVRSLFPSRLDSFFDANIAPRGVLPSLYDSLSKYNLFHYLELWFGGSIFPTCTNWKTIVKTKIFEKEADDDWFRFCSDHPCMRVAEVYLENISPHVFWSIASRYPDLLCRLYVQIRLMGNFGLDGGVPWLTNIDNELCLFCKDSVKDVSHFLVDCPSFRDNFESLWSNLSQKIIACNRSDETHLSHFISGLGR